MCASIREDHPTQRACDGHAVAQDYTHDAPAPMRASRSQPGARKQHNPRRIARSQTRPLTATPADYNAASLTYAAMARTGAQKRRGSRNPGAPRRNPTI
ncbi:hypothetical protein C2L64_10710 [Paraburkholderia hospita]|uniref:Uncharacterized protein n=1 Tax=Paraburkholderia hospita TaxID=169430 RepID=A0AAN1MIZ2_9BURK|nr:hypothetical protein C2L64_10710 [Paraburkholderia hospita]